MKELNEYEFTSSRVIAVSDSKQICEKELLDYIQIRPNVKQKEILTTSLTIL